MLWRYRLFRLPRHLSLCRRLRLTIHRTENDQYRCSLAASQGVAGRSPADVDLRRSAQRHGSTRVQEAIRADSFTCYRTQQLCTVGQSDAAATVLAMAADPDGGLEYRHSRSRGCTASPRAFLSTSHVKESGSLCARAVEH